MQEPFFGVRICTQCWKGANQLEKEYPDVCRIFYKDGCLFVENKIKNWRNEQETDIDEITYYISEEAEKSGLKSFICEGYILAYSDCNEETAKTILESMPDFSCHKREAGIGETEKNNENKQKHEANYIKEESVYTFQITIKELFEEIRMDIPNYQRPYRWSKKNIESFWNDIKKEEKPEEFTPYDFGFIVLHDNNGKFEIIDGQQRLVTLSLILKSLEDETADSFISSITLQGIESEKNVGYNLQWFIRQKEKLNEEERKFVKDRILKGQVDIVIMKDINDALRFFDRMNTSAVELTKTDILKSHHLLALSGTTDLSEEAKERWKTLGIIEEEQSRFKQKIVETWERDVNAIAEHLSAVSILKTMAKGDKPYLSGYDIEDIEQFRGGINPEAKYTGLDSPICDGEFFFWFAFNLKKKHDNLEKDDPEYRRLKNLANRKPWFYYFFKYLTLYIREKFPNEVNNEVYKDLIDLVFSWLTFLEFYYSSLGFKSIVNDALSEDSLFRAIIESSSIQDCFDSFHDNPLDLLEENGLGDNIGSDKYYLIRRELRKIYE